MQGSLVWLADGVVGLGSSHAGRALRPGSARTSESAVPAGLGSLTTGINPVNDVLVYD
jgi:hypothetical protein